MQQSLVCTSEPEGPDQPFQGPILQPAQEIYFSCTWVLSPCLNYITCVLMFISPRAVDPIDSIFLPWIWTCRITMVLLSVHWTVADSWLPSPDQIQTQNGWISFLTRPQICVITMNLDDDLDSCDYLTLHLVWIFFVVAKDNSFSWPRIFLLADLASRAVRIHQHRHWFCTAVLVWFLFCRDRSLGLCSEPQNLFLGKGCRLHFTSVQPLYQPFCPFSEILLSRYCLSRKPTCPVDRRCYRGPIDVCIPRSSSCYFLVQGLHELKSDMQKKKTNSEELW